MLLRLVQCQKRHGLQGVITGSLGLGGRQNKERTSLNFLLSIVSFKACVSVGEILQEDGLYRLNLLVTKLSKNPRHCREVQRSHTRGLCSEALKTNLHLVQGHELRDE